MAQFIASKLNNGIGIAIVPKGRPRFVLIPLTRVHEPEAGLAGTPVGDQLRRSGIVRSYAHLR